MCGGAPARAPAPPPPPPAAPVVQPPKAAKGRRRTQASATFSTARQAASEKAGYSPGTLLSQNNVGVGNTLLGA